MSVFTLIALLDKTIALTLGLCLSTVSVLARGGYSLGKRAIYGKQKTTDEIILEEITFLKRTLKELQEKERERDMKIEQTLDQLIKNNYNPKELAHNNSHDESSSQ